MTRDKREALRKEIAVLGFDEVRFASAATIVSNGFSDWLAAGHHADMDWLQRGEAKRLDPPRVLTEVRTVIALGVNYRPAGEAGTQQRWARYALHSDYHDTIGAGLRAAGACLEKHAGLTRDDYRAYVDTGPVLERGWAAAAGLGWQGKNAMLISRGHGNWLFLAVILARLDVQPDDVLGSQVRAIATPIPPTAALPAVGHHCGTCTRCLTACPTAAFPEPGRVDARRCISYHTIENRGIVPRELRAKFGGRVFGCDVCLDVCPWNRFARIGRSMLLETRHELAGLSLLDLLGMDETRFRDVFRKTPMKRTKLTGLLRNACIAAGNWHDTKDWHFGGADSRENVIAAVERLCAHDHEIVRAHAVWALGRLVGPEQALARLGVVRCREHAAVVLDEYAGLNPTWHS